MKITLDTDIVQNYNWSIEEALLLLYLSVGESLDKTLESLKTKGLIYNSRGSYRPFFKTCEKLEDILNTSNNAIPVDTFKELAITLMSIMPQGKVEGTPYYFKCNKYEVAQSLQRFYVEYNSDNEYSHEDIIRATMSYVESFEGDYTYMALLKNFIYRSTDNSSELASYLENIKDESS